MGHIVLDLTTKSSDRSGHPKRHVILAMSERKPVYPAHALDMHEDEDEDDKPLVRPTTRKEPHKEGRDQAIHDEDLAPLVPPRLRDLLRPHCDRRKRDHQYGRIQSNCFSGTRGVKGLA